jgi:3-methylcrotonyl-CoA carboxylase alpha subunit
MLRRLLVANRGEIACRVIRTARRLGVHTVAVYSDADADARHVRLAHEAIRLGPAPPRDSYLAIERVLDAARAAGADAVHPGYGFLSENAEFAAACERAGIVFVGPPSGAIAAMGSKSAAKDAMARAGVPVLPGYHGGAQDLETLEREARGVGFPLIVKPSGGGGGKGMQIVADQGELREALAAARRLAASAFADPTLLVERYVPAPRHVEVQVLLDDHGTALHLGTRDCSVQRRHQKLLEEAPAPGIPADVRERLHAAALTVARAVDYRNAGTVEFLYDDGEFWFMEMNTRLQVEHCVTEEVYGLDLVEWQLRIASGERLPFAQADLVARGHAVEARVCAEDPSAGFVPSAGRLARLEWPTPSPRLRVDAGFESGDVVPANYDSLLGKVVGIGPDRAGALAALADGLAGLRVAGVATNREWLLAAVRTPAFVRGEVTTRFVAEHAGSLQMHVAPDDGEFALAAVTWVELQASVESRASPWSAYDAYRPNLPWVQRVRLASGERSVDADVERSADGWSVRIAQACYAIRWHPIAATGTAAPRGGDAEATLDGRRSRIEWLRDGTSLRLWRGERALDVAIVDPRDVDPDASAHEGELVARLPGTVVAVAVVEGQHVEAGTTLLVLEAMKMEHSIVAPRSGTVLKLRYAAGERVPEGAVLIELGE